VPAHARQSTQVRDACQATVLDNGGAPLDQPEPCA
jgi:hypothetical protein